MPKEEGLKVTEEAKEVAREISVRGCFWSDGYTDSFADVMDRLRYLERERTKYSNGAKLLRDACEKSDRDPLWKELELDPADRDGIKYCCDKIIAIMR